MTEDISCENCVAACCKAPTHMQLRDDEFKRHSPPMDLKVVIKPRAYAQRAGVEGAPGRYVEIPSGFGLFELVSGCANLDDDDRCSIYSTRPQCCRDFAVGSVACLKARRKAGLDADRPPLDEEDAPLSGNAALVAEFFADADRAAAPRPPAPTGHERRPVPLADIRALVYRETEWLRQRLASCDAVMWSRRTRCSEWRVGDVAAHLVTAQRVAQEVLTAAIEGHDASLPADFTGDRDATVAAFDRAARDIVDVLGRVPQATVERDVVIDGDESVSVQHLLEVLAMELTVHGLDVANALGEPRRLASDAVPAIANALPELLDPAPPTRPGTAYVLRTVAFELPFSWDGSTWRHESVDGACRIEGDVEAVLLFALGRERFDPKRLTTNQASLAKAFKRHLAGP